MADGTNTTQATDPAEIGRLVARCGELKTELVAFAQTRRFDRFRDAELRKASDDPGGTAPDPGSSRWIAAMDDFIMTFRFPDDTGVIDRFLTASGKSLRKSDRVLLKGWLDPVDGIVELRAIDVEANSITLHNLIDELDYLAYPSNSVRAMPAEPGDFALVRLVPVMPGAWTVSGSLTPFPREHAKVVAELALDWLTSRPRLAFRNPEKLERGWELMREDRAKFTEFFGSDQVTLPPQEALDRLNAYYRGRAAAGGSEGGSEGAAEGGGGEGGGGGDTAEPFFTLPDEELKLLTTIGVIYDETDGMSLLPDFRTLEELFTDPGLAADPAHADALVTYLNSDSIYPGPLRRLAAGHPDTVDDVYRAVLKKPSFTWEKQGEPLLRKRKPWYFKQNRYPKTTPTSDYLIELLSAEN